MIIDPKWIAFAMILNAIFRWSREGEWWFTNEMPDYAVMFEPNDELKEEVLRCSVNGTPYDECGFCEYFNCDTCKCEADVPQTERSK